MRVVATASALISVHASWVASSETTGTVWKWSYTQIDSKTSPSSAYVARPAMASHCWAGVDADQVHAPTLGYEQSESHVLHPVTGRRPSGDPRV